MATRFSTFLTRLTSVLIQQMGLAVLLLPIFSAYAADPPAPPLKTGQTSTSTLGEDGALQKGVAWPSPRFTDNNNGTVTDNLTKLIWLKDANCWENIPWSNALTNASSLASGSCGLTDGSAPGSWRLPNFTELSSLLDFGRFNPALPAGHPFTNVQSKYYWSSSTYAGNTSSAWYVGIYEGYVDSPPKTNSYYVWPVRGGQ